MHGWETTFILGRPIFRGYVSFREGSDDRIDRFFSMFPMAKFQKDEPTRLRFSRNSWAFVLFHPPKNSGTPTNPLEILEQCEKNKHFFAVIKTHQ